MSLTLVTGGAGFIGAHLVRALLARGRQVRVLDDLSSGDRANLAGLPVEFVLGDIRRAEQVEQAAAGAQVIYHLAAMVSVPRSMADPAGCYAANVLGSVNILEAARRGGARRVVLSSSCAVYGAVDQPAEETLVPQPASPYAASKVAMEDAARLYARSLGVATVCLRYFNVYGPRQPQDSEYAAVIPRLISAMQAGRRATIHGDGGQTRDFVYVEDVVSANLLAADGPVDDGRPINIASGRSISINQLADNLHALIPGAPAPRHGPPRPGDLRLSAGNIELAEQALGFRPNTAWEDGLRSTVEWFGRQETASGI
jgi:nucleoside-diphosphate-sugar epimerase